MLFLILFLIHIIPIQEPFTSKRKFRKDHIEIIDIFLQFVCFPILLFQFFESNPFIIIGINNHSY